ncbi:murein biosynthesis integral membrane protein MurJ [Bifidobacterium sp. UMB1197]|nr:murein biosynthesis integral membrane protein MurJ [Bifidobacterium sp. UMB1197]
MNSVGRNSIIMASGTAASRITGQIRTILLAAALGTTGLAANAYQAGSMIPQLIYTLVSGGIFNAVLVPQIVKTLEKQDAKNRLNKLITFAIILLLGVTVLMAIATPVLTWLYVGTNPAMIALTNAFTLWCMPQIFFYGLYTVLGQVLAAKGKFAMYAWSSVAANIVSCTGFGVFIAIFGRASRQPAHFWNNTTMLLTAGFWTLGVAAQALVLFIPLKKIGLKYRPSFGISGIGLRSMGPVAGWSFAIVAVSQLSTMATTHITTSAPSIAEETLGLSQFDVAGNATFQNAYTMFILPYSLIAVSVATAVFPKISRAITNHDLATVRADLSSCLRSVSILMCFFSVAFIVIPMPISLALLPSISIKEAYLMADPLMMLSLGLPLSSAYLIIQRTFYAFEDGKHPFMFCAAQLLVELFIVFSCIQFLPANYWVGALAAAASVSYILTFPALVKMIRSRFNNNLDDKQLVVTHLKVLVASVVSIVVGILAREFIYKWISLDSPSLRGVNRWLLAIFVCAVITIVLAVVYISTLLLLKTGELASIINPVLKKIGIKWPFLLNIERANSANNSSNIGSNNSSSKTANKNKSSRIVRSK